MSDKNIKHNQLRLKLYEKLSEAEALEANGDPGISHNDMMARLITRLRKLKSSANS